jgi:hypothetical protein
VRAESLEFLEARSVPNEDIGINVVARTVVKIGHGQEFAAANFKVIKVTCTVGPQCLELLEASPIPIVDLGPLGGVGAAYCHIGRAIHFEAR